ncbi:MAG: hypothetical protein HYV28_02945 [Ignavibacteriales bacterium]|nr:hypothetical protein [Ignavibacteriales bacterium]
MVTPNQHRQFKLAFVLLFLVILSITVLKAQSVAISNASFEIVRNDNFTAWNTTSDSLCKVSPDWQIFSSGNVSCNFSHPIPGTTKLYSLPVKLITGQLYRLSGKIKTQNAVTSRTDQYPTPVAACLSMKSFPFTNHSPAVGATHDWQTVEVYFYAAAQNDQIVLNFGYNGKAAGKVWFDDIVLEKVNDLSKMIDPLTIKQYKKGFRYEDKGWINIHLEGKPFERGMQYGYLVAAEIKEFINKLSIQRQKENPVAAWNNLRTQVDLLFLRKFDEEFLTEMKGIAEGVNTAGVQIFNRQVDLLDIVTLNSEIDLDYAEDAIKKTAHSLSGKTLQSAEGDNELQDRLHKCSGILATKSATADSRVVFGQLFMWGGYTGPHWNIFVDVVPENGYRLVYQTFPGGIHSGADFYLNAKGIIIGETTVGQTPFNINGTPQSNRIRKAAQYASSVDDVVKIMTTDNNGLYTNDWLIADTKIDEVAILLLGTEKYKL